MISGGLLFFFFCDEAKMTPKHELLKRVCSAGFHRDSLVQVSSQPAALETEIIPKAQSTGTSPAR